MKLRTLLILTLAITVSSCASIEFPVAVMGLDGGTKATIKDETRDLDYPSQLASTSNIYSCRYGISYKSGKELMPSRADIFGELLARNRPDLMQTEVTLTRFDVFYNNRLQALAIGGQQLGGGLGQVLTEASLGAIDTPAAKNFLIDSLPEDYPKQLKENAVGCDGRGEGEYYSSRLTGGSQVFVTWLDFEVNAQEYSFRTVYSFDLDDEYTLLHAFTDAMEKTMSAAGARVEASPDVSQEK
ncbi:hypothetical protein [Microbulbifer guangxiensis]|uniref:hypothetical protein n=1 Tax=Microbulbifer guangxiensis TaxID=2904249 RepID=UPI001F474BFA|nr:hypothetical protein [Microbulbifer guangxiensis]